LKLGPVPQFVDPANRQRIKRTKTNKTERLQNKTADKKDLEIFHNYFVFFNGSSNSSKGNNNLTQLHLLMFFYLAFVSLFNFVLQHSAV